MPNAKYDWAVHLPRMIELYLEQYSIPKIHEAIQNMGEGFTPSLAIVYAKLKSEGYPTEPAERNKLLRQLNIARWPSELSMRSADGRRQQLQVASHGSDNGASLAKSQNLVYPRVASSHYTQQESKKETPNSNSTPWTLDSSRLTNGSPMGSNLEITSETPTEQSLESHLFTLPEEVPGWNRIDTDDVTGFREQDGVHWGFGGADSFPDLGIENPEGTFKTPSLSTSDLHPYTNENLNDSQRFFSLIPTGTVSALSSETHDSYGPTSIANEDDSPYPLDTPSPFTQPTTSTSTPVPRFKGTPYFGGHFLPWWRKEIPKHNRCLTPEKRNSTATNDSGYASGRNSPGNLLMEGERAHPRSLTEFNRLYRVPCLRLHEPRTYNKVYMPQPVGRFKETEKCPHCQYSGIHNLSWSVKQLKREVFMSELKLDSIYNITDLDNAGNSALHYAAVGGAGFEHFVALIGAGANPYQLNTAGQLFLHCLRPQLKQAGCDAFDPHLVATFNLDLVNLLNYFQRLNDFQPTPALRWRDNGGMTAVDALALQVNDTGIAHQIIGAIFNAGHLSQEELDQSKRALRNVKSTSKGLPTLATDCHPSCTPRKQNQGPKSDFEHNEERQTRAWDIFRRASKAPSYVDPETGDNALHALARLRFCRTGSHKKILANIRNLILKDGVDLNLRNRECDSPIASFICEEHFRGIKSDETGATMSKYLDALLWKDPLRRIPNKINVNMRNREGATALYYAAVRGRPDSVRSLIEAGANVNATLVVEELSISILQATQQARSKAVHENDMLKIHLLNNVISYLEYEDAIVDPTIFDERRLCPNSVRVMPM